MKNFTLYLHYSPIFIVLKLFNSYFPLNLYLFIDFTFTGSLFFCKWNLLLHSSEVTNLDRSSLKIKQIDFDIAHNSYLVISLVFRGFPVR